MVINELNKITSRFQFIYILSALMIRDFTGPVEDLLNGHNHEILSYNEAAFIIGLWLKNCQITEVQEFEFEIEMSKVDELLKQMHLELMPALDYNSISSMKSPSQIMMNSKSMKEAFFYSSTGAYDIQYIELA